jgi:hypothetical protein
MVSFILSDTVISSKIYKGLTEIRFQPVRMAVKLGRNIKHIPVYTYGDARTDMIAVNKMIQDKRTIEEVYAELSSKKE